MKQEQEQRHKSVIMDTKELLGCFALASTPATPLCIKQNVKSKVAFTIIPQGIVGIGYKFMVTCSIPIRWDRLQAVIHRQKKQTIPLQERIERERYPY